MDKNQNTIEELFYQTKKDNLNSKKIEFYITKAIQGDFFAKEIVAEFYIKKIDKLIENKYNEENYNKEELRQAGYLGLAIALKKYKKNSHIYFSTHANNIINRYITKEIKNQNEEIINIKIENVYNDFIVNIENKELLNSAINNLNDRYKKILFLYVYEGYTFEEISKMFNLTDGRIQQIYKRSLEILKEKLTIQNEDKKIKEQSKSI